MKTILSLAALLVLLCVSGCTSCFNVEVAILNVGVMELRQAQEAQALVAQYEESFRKIQLTAQQLGIANGTVASRVSVAVADANAAVLSLTERDATKRQSVYLENRTNIAVVEIQNSLSNNIAAVVGEWPALADQQSGLDNLKAKATALRKRAEALSQIPRSSPLAEIMALQAGFARDVEAFKAADLEVKELMQKCLGILNSLEGAVSGQIDSQIVAIQAGGSEYQTILNLLVKKKKLVQEIPRSTAQIEQNTMAARRLVEHDASVDLSDPNWRFVAGSPDQNWNTFQTIHAAADGEANYVIIQQSMGDFRIKKVFNDPTEGYKAGVNIGKKVFEVVGTAAIAATTGGVVPPLAKSSGGGINISNSLPQQLSDLNSMVAETQVQLAESERSRATALKALQEVATKLSAIKDPTNVTPALLQDVTNRLVIYRSLLKTGN